MAKKQHRWAVAHVYAAWYDRTVRKLAADARPSGGEVHILTGWVRDGTEDNLAGLWFTKIVSTWLNRTTKDPAAVDLLVPWRYVETVGRIASLGPRSMAFGPTSGA